MNFPPEIQFHEDVRLFVYRPVGLIDEAAIDKVVGLIGELETASQAPFNRFADTLGADEVELNFQFIIRISLFRRLTYAGKPPVKSAILATDSALIHYGRLHALLTQGSPIHVQVFQSREDAADWLEVPIERLIKSGTDKATI